MSNNSLQSARIEMNETPDDGWVWIHPHSGMEMTPKPLNHQVAAKNLEAAVRSPHKYFVLAHGSHKWRRAFNVPPGIAIVFMTTPGATATSPYSAQLLTMEESARSLISKEHPEFYSVTYLSGNSVPDVSLAFPLEEHGRHGVYKVPLKTSGVSCCSNRYGRCLGLCHACHPNVTGYMNRFWDAFSSTGQSYRATLFDVVKHFASGASVKYTTEEPVVLFVGSCRSIKQETLNPWYNPENIYEYCARHNDAACRQIKKTFPRMTLKESIEYGGRPFSERKKKKKEEREKRTKSRPRPA
jgi:hypothetical protein